VQATNIEKQFLYRKPRVANLTPAGQMRPVWLFAMARIEIFVTQFRVQNTGQNESPWLADT